MLTSQWSPRVILVLLAATIFLTMTVAMMLGPLLVELSRAFHTTVALTGQLTAATAITWALTAWLAGPLSDMYGRRRIMAFRYHPRNFLRWGNSADERRIQQNGYTVQFRQLTALKIKA